MQARKLQNQNQFYFHVQLSRVESKLIESRIAHAGVPVTGFPVDQNSEAVDERDVPTHTQRFTPSTCFSSHKWTDTLIYGMFVACDAFHPSHKWTDMLIYGMVVTCDAFDPRDTTLDAAHCGGPANKSDLDRFDFFRVMREWKLGRGRRNIAGCTFRGIRSTRSL